MPAKKKYVAVQEHTKKIGKKKVKVRAHLRRVR
jgi:hypothetical protein